MTGSFASTVPYYVRYRAPYPMAMIAEAARAAELDRPGGKARVLDLGCGPAYLALAFGLFADEAVGVDPEPLMLEEAEKAARAANVRLQIIHGLAENLDPAAVGSFRLATIGRAFHWMDQERVLAMLARVIEPEGGVVIFEDRYVEDAAIDPWSVVWRRCIQPYFAPEVAERYFNRIDIADRYGPHLQAAGFDRLTRLSHTTRFPITIDFIIGRTLSMSRTSPERLGDGAPAFVQGLREALEPFAVDGVLMDSIENTAVLGRRA